MGAAKVKRGKDIRMLQGGSSVREVRMNGRKDSEMCTMGFDCVWGK